MKVFLEEGKIVLRFTFNFIIHQLLLFMFISIPIFISMYYKNWDFANADYSKIHQNIVITSVIILYIVYCIFYGYYVAYPMTKIIVGIRKLASGDYDNFRNKNKVNPSNHLYKEVFENLEILSQSLQEEKLKREEFEKQREVWAAGVTHDLKTPLSYISGYTDMLLSKEYDWTEDEKEKFISIIRSKSDYIRELIDDLGLAFSINNGFETKVNKEKIELVETLRRVVAEVANYPNNNENIFEFKSDIEQIYIMGDRRLLIRAFLNLLMNSITHNPTGTKVITQIIDNNTEIIIKIIDDGKGMNEDDIAHLFERYYRGTATDIHISGTGLGMAIVKQIVELHYGTINVESKLGTGTQFIIRFSNK
ncbi:TPA: sensor histidine kinase [Enterococcus faecalis]|nr:HAMP domain-containing histidine kinase [Enterococcus faecalis]HBE2178976.1 HAMP domain-containing histidine kinase [Enterococcus faecalis]HBE2185022.1 HAMP domain-containing histidine kinase [Enterococcus faecalis]